MKKILTSLVGLVSVLVLALPATVLAALYPVQVQNFSVCPQGISINDTTVCIQSLKDINGNALSMTAFGSMGFGTIDPNNGAQEESITWTGITQNSNGTATLTGVNDVTLYQPFVLTGQLTKNHAGGATFVVSNTSYFYYRMFGIVDNNVSITGEWTVPEPTNASDIASKNYVDTKVNGGSISIDKVTPAGVAGESISAGKVVYFDTSLGQWKIADSTKPSFYTLAVLGVAQGAGTIGNAISGGVMLLGLDANQTGLTTGANYFLSTSGGLTTSTSSISVGKAKDSTHLYVNPGFADGVSVGSNNTFTGTNTFASTTSLATSTNIGFYPAYNIGKNGTVITSTGTSTYSVPNGVTKLLVRIIGAGGPGDSVSSSCSGSSNAGLGGASASYLEGIVDVSATSTITVHVDTAGGGKYTSFGIPDGVGGTMKGFMFAPSANGSTPGGAPSASSTVSVSLSITGQSGGNQAQTGTTIALGGTGASTVLGSGGRGANGGNNSTAATGYGAGGGGGSCLNGNSAGVNGTAGTQGIIIVRW